MILSIVVPIYNESNILESSVYKILDFYASWDFELILVNDGSNDETENILNSFDSCKIVVLNNYINRGKGFSIMEGIKKAKGDFVLIMDADLRADLSNFNILFSNINKYDIVIGSRYLTNSKISVKQSKIRIFISRLGNLLIRFLFGLDIKDTQCGYKIFNRNVANKIIKYQKINRFAWDIEFLSIANKLGYSILEVPITWSDVGGSKFNLFSDTISSFIDLIFIYFNLLKFKK